MRKLNHEGQSLNSDYAFLCPDKLEPSDQEPKAPLDYAERDDKSFSADLSKTKPSRFQRLKTWLNTPMEIR